MMTMTRVVTIRAMAFIGGRVESIRCTVDEDGTVRVFDSAAGYFTTCHSLSAGAQNRARKLAAAHR